MGQNEYWALLEELRCRHVAHRRVRGDGASAADAQGPYIPLRTLFDTRPTPNRGPLPAAPANIVPLAGVEVESRLSTGVGGTTAAGPTGNAQQQPEQQANVRLAECSTGAVVPNVQVGAIGGQVVSGGTKEEGGGETGGGTPRVDAPQVRL